jgi:hypothetical protein
MTMSDRDVKCTICGAVGELGCDHGEGAYRPLSYFVTEAVKKTPKKSDRAHAKDLGVHHSTVNEARKQLSDYPTVEKRVGLDGKARRMPRLTRRATATEAEAAGFKATGEARVLLDTGKTVSKFEATRIEEVTAATRAQDAIIAELKAENEQLRYELTQRPTIDEVRRLDASDRRAQRIVTDTATYNLLRRCLHPDSRGSVSAEILHEAWLAFRNLEPLVHDKSKLPPPLPRDLNELLARRYNKMNRKQA